MSIGERIKGAVAPIVPEVAADTYTGDADTYCTWNATEIPTAHADNEPHAIHYLALLHLRVRDSSPQQRTAAAEYASAHLAGLPYGFFCGFGAEKAPASPSSLQCAYLPWFAWQAQGVDLDSDGGRLTTVLDLAQSPHLEVVSSRGQPLPDKK